jgi:hypothetical protein
MTGDALSPAPAKRSDFQVMTLILAELSQHDFAMQQNIGIFSNSIRHVQFTNLL